MSKEVKKGMYTSDAPLPMSEKESTAGEKWLAEYLTVPGATERSAALAAFQVGHAAGIASIALKPHPYFYADNPDDESGFCQLCDKPKAKHGPDRLTSSQ